MAAGEPYPPIYMKCANPACTATKMKQRWIVSGIVYCSPWCQRHRGHHPNEVGMFKRVYGLTRKN